MSIKWVNHREENHDLFNSKLIWVTAHIQTLLMLIGNRGTNEASGFVLVSHFLRKTSLVPLNDLFGGILSKQKSRSQMAKPPGEIT